MSDKPSLPPRVFISYSWTSPEHINRIIGWGERLRSDGVDVILDRWDLKEGQDKFVFMEKMVSDAEVKRVLIFSDAMYATKANARKGGVGTEAQIISKEIYDKVDQHKFIPIVCEYADGKACLPIYFESRIYIDFSSPELQNENYDQLLRIIYDRPRFIKPVIGQTPAHLFEENPIPLRSHIAFQSFKESVLQDKSNCRGLAFNYLKVISASFGDLKINYDDDADLAENILDKIKKFLPAKNEFVEFLELIVLYKNDSDIYENLADFWESLFSYRGPSPEMGQFSYSMFEHYGFLIKELFLYFVATLLRHRRFKEAREVLDRNYMVPTNNQRKSGLRDYSCFLSYSEALDQRNKKLGLRRISPQADLIKERCVSKEISFEHLKQADFVLFLFSVLNLENYQPWYPETLVYAGYNSEAFEIFERSSSRKYFENLKILFNVRSGDELRSKFTTSAEQQNLVNWGYLTGYSGVSFRDLMNFQKLDSV